MFKRYFVIQGLMCEGLVHTYVYFSFLYQSSMVTPISRGNSIFWPGNTLVSHKRSWKMLLKRGTSGIPLFILL